jgi:outer membrane protein
MKQFFRNLLIISLLASTISSFAQTEKGSWMIGGSLGLTIGNNANYDDFKIYLKPQAGYFILKKLAIGTGIELSYENSIADYPTVPGSSYKYHISIVGFTPFARYYFGEKKLKPFIQAIYTYSYFSEVNNPTGGIETSNSGYTANSTLGGGFAYFIAPNVSLDATLDYQVFRTSEALVFNNQPAFKMGFQIFLPKK